ncbi:hypothetical protein FSP39_024932 [Pinctada imbricata]|uniref:DUF4291 domain-containing protein n=1 Tax=Pinctada imbricata TaxID=66713 RepID=A0AA88XGY5_PINIB|nr:hypothetical protein FSP39_024932 [Pinctada imbricata]
MATCSDSDTNTEYDQSHESDFTKPDHAKATGLDMELYVKQRDSEHWPKSGQHILAQFTDEDVVVYQAFKQSIASYAVENQQFGGPDYSLSRMSWIKTNFLWMMYRSGWSTKSNQQHILAIKIKRKAFDDVLANAYTAQYQKSMGIETKDIEVRLQWDPDHKPDYTNENRRAIQLGLKGETLQKFGTTDIVSITDITKFVREQKKILDKGGQSQLIIPRERVYPVADPNVRARIGLDEVS